MQIGKSMAAWCAAWLAAFAAADPAERAPGVFVRVFQIDASVSQIPDLLSDQLPNAATAAPRVDFDGEILGLRENFVTEVRGWLNVPRDGQYQMRLISDDGSRLYLGTREVIDHDGPHGPTPKDALVELRAGPQPFRIRHYQGGGGVTLRLQWKPAGDDGEFETIPADHFSHDASESTAVAPGPKRILAPLRRGRPGDGTMVDRVHPISRQVFTNAPNDELVAWVRDERVWGTSYALPKHRPTPEAWVPAHEGDVHPFAAWEIKVGPYAGQRYVTCYQGSTRVGAPEHGRVFRDQVGDQFQGCYFRCSTLGNRRPEPASEPFVPPFEMVAVRAMSNGLEIEFSHPLDARAGWEPESFYIEQWPFSSADAKAPTRDGFTYPPKSASVSEDRKRVFLELDSLKPGHLVYLRLLPPMLSESGELPWSTEAWYTLNTIPTDRAGHPRPRPPLEPANFLTDAEKAEGWKLLFDGKTTAGWRGFGKREMAPGWQVIDGCLVRTGPGGDIITDEQFDDFELSLEWRVSVAGNSGIFYRVSEEPPNRWVWETGPEMQVLDNAEHPDGRSPLTSAGANYALHAPPRDVTRPVGLFNHARIIVRGNHVEHWLNDEKLVEYELHSDDWRTKVAGSKFNAMPRYGSVRKGGIALQDHGDRVWFRNIKIRPLKAE